MFLDPKTHLLDHKMHLTGMVAHGRDRFENLVHDLREMLRLKQGKKAQPSATVIDSRFVRSTPESGHRAAFNGHKAQKGSKLHAVVDTLGNLLALCVTAGNIDDRVPVEALCEQVRELSGENVRVMFADQAYIGEQVLDDAEFQGIDLVVVNRPEGSRGFVLLPKRWVVEAIPPVSDHAREVHFMVKKVRFGIKSGLLLG